LNLIHLLVDPIHLIGRFKNLSAFHFGIFCRAWMIGLGERE